MCSQVFSWVGISRQWHHRLSTHPALAYCLGASGVARLFHDGVLRKMAKVNERPIIFAL